MSAPEACAGCGSTDTTAVIAPGVIVCRECVRRALVAIDTADARAGSADPAWRPGPRTGGMRSEAPDKPASSIAAEGDRGLNAMEWGAAVDGGSAGMT